MKPLGKVNMAASPALYYAIGLITTDGSLSKDGRHIVFTSKDKDLARSFQDVLGIRCMIGRFANGTSPEKRYYRVQFGDVQFYRFLLGIGLTPNKSKTVRALNIPNKYFFDFLRGHFDGDGSFYSYWDPRWRSSYMFYTVFCSASRKHIDWLQKRIRLLLGIHGHMTSGKKKICYQLKYAKGDSLILLRKLYYKKNLSCLQRKRFKIQKALTKIGKSI